MKLFKSIAERVAALIVLFVLTGIGLAFTEHDESPKKPKGFITGSDVVGRTTDASLVVFNLRGHVFHVPRNYLWIKSQWQGVKKENEADLEIYMQATANDLLPYSENTKDLFSVGGNPNRTLKFNVSVGKFDRLYGEQFLINSASRLIERCEAWKHGLRICSGDQVEAQDFSVFETNDLILSKWAIENKVVIVCSGLNQPGLTYPHCGINYRYKPHLFATITFERSHLHRAKELISIVNQRLDTFYVENHSGK